MTDIFNPIIAFAIGIAIGLVVGSFIAVHAERTNISGSFIVGSPDDPNGYGTMEFYESIPDMCKHGRAMIRVVVDPSILSENVKNTDLNMR